MAVVINTGGAEGADYCFAEEAAQRKIPVFMFTFPGHRCKIPQTPQRINVRVMTTDDFWTAQPLVDKANASLKRSTGKLMFTQHLLKRDAFIALNSNAIYAISDFDKSGNGVGVQRGTAWACQVFYDRMEPGMLRLFLFSQSKNSWWQCYKGVPGDKTKNGPWMRWLCGSPAAPVIWKQIDKPEPLKGTVACIGTRDLKENGRQAIKSLFV